MSALWLALLLAAPAPGCERAAEAAALLAAAAGRAAESLAEEADRLAADAARGGPAGGLGALAAELGASGTGERAARAERFAAALAWHCRLAEQPQAAGLLSPADRATLERLLSEPRFSRSRTLPDQVRAWLGQLWDRLAELLGTEEAEQVASRGRTAFFAAAALLAGAVALGALRRRRGRRDGEVARPAAEAPPASEAAPPDAEAALAAGQSGEAVRAALLSSLLALERAGRLPSGRALTNREAAQRLARTAPEAAALFEQLGAAFDRMVYGQAAPGPGEAAACVAAARRLRTALGGGAP